MPFALVYGKALTKIPEDLYIPPDALEVFLEAFEGPLDLLLYLIRRQNMDILDIQVAEITRQYMGYIDIMQSMKFELAAEYLVMAAMLGEIKSRCLLPRPRDTQGEDGEDPRAELIRRLQEYERYKQAALDLDALPMEGRDFFVAIATAPIYTRLHAPPEVELDELLLALRDVLKRAELYESHHVGHEGLSLRERMADILQALQEDEFLSFFALFHVEEGRLGVVVSFIALLELIKEGLLDLVQAESFAPIYVRHRRTQTEELAP
ncbi:MAG: segregation/condensation protein A [Pseudomonadales bacterium]|nr:segregation/condensation protein A [Pseudomonadales bacterium]